MIFFARSERRTAFVRTTALLMSLFVVCTVVLFLVDTRDPTARCTACTPDRYHPSNVPEHWVALTFDDGPTHDATPKILATLKEHNVHATFFVLGRFAFANPSLLARVASDGHDIGNHSFTHEEFIQGTEQRVAWELNVTNKLIESVTGRSALLYRPPFLDEMDPFTVLPDTSEHQVWSWVNQHNYVTVGSDLDSFDWQSKTPNEVLLSVEKLIEEKETNPDARNRHVFLFHDVPVTADALDEIIVYLKERGYRIVPLSTLIGVSQDEVMPKAGFSIHSLWYQILLQTTQGLGIVLFAILVFITLFTAIRFAILVSVVVWLRMKKDVRVAPIPSLQVTVLVPAYNESVNVEATLRSIMANHHSPHEVVVIDDGSTDDTASVARAVADTYEEGRIRVISTKNQGKASALNLGLSMANGEVVVAIDGDTVLDPYCIGEVLRAFSSPRVGAVAGKIVPATFRTILERFQALEYLIGQAMDKTVISCAGAVNIVPGAIGAWRKDVALAAGGYSKDTLVEDQDLTLAVLSLGYEVRYAPLAVAYTEVPRSLRALYLQRFRWTYGTFQCVYKYRSCFFSDHKWRIGFIALPYTFVFNVVTPMSAFVLYFATFLAVVMRMSHPAVHVLIVFTVLDLLYGLLALWGDATLKKHTLLLIVVQRFWYAVLYAVLVSLVMLKVLDGSPTRWNKLKRTGSAQAYFFDTYGNPAEVREANTLPAMKPVYA